MKTRRDPSGICEGLQALITVCPVPGHGVREGHVESAGPNKGC